MAWRIKSWIEPCVNLGLKLLSFLPVCVCAPPPQHGHSDVVRYLLEHGADASIKDMRYVWSGGYRSGAKEGGQMMGECGLRRPCVRYPPACRDRGHELGAGVESRGRT